MEIGNPIPHVPQSSVSDTFLTNKCAAAGAERRPECTKGFSRISLSISDGGNRESLICIRGADNDFYGEIRFECKQRDFFGPSPSILMGRSAAVNRRR